MSARLLEERTGEDVEAWNRGIQSAGAEVLAWLQRAYDENC